MQTAGLQGAISNTETNQIKEPCSQEYIQVGAGVEAQQVKSPSGMGACPIRVQVPALALCFLNSFLLMDVGRQQQVIQVCERPGWNFWLLA